MGKLKLAVVTIVLALLLSACNINQEPPWLVRLTPILPGIAGFCSGVVFGPNFILTDYHCAKYRHVVLQENGQEIELDADSTMPILGQDLAIMYSPDDMILSSYAKMANPQPGLARVYGHCPRYTPGLYRPVEYVQRLFEFDMDLHLTITDQWQSSEGSDHPYICGGDSGGAIVQNGKVVGLVLTKTKTDFTFRAIPIACLLELNAYMTKNNGIAFPHTTGNEDISADGPMVQLCL